MLVGKELGPYKVEKELGSGAMGTVFRAKNLNSGERVAIKLMSLGLGSSDAAQKRFRREVDILKQLDHPNIVRYKGSGRYHGAPFYIMEYAAGESLDRILSRRGRLPWEEVVELGVYLCAALQHAHDHGIIHRDLKPSNLMILPDGVVKLTDFGIAKDQDVTALTNVNSTVGTAAYMSPEQCRGARDISYKTDLYSMGIMFYELLTGRKPFVGDTAMEVFLQHANKTDFKRPAQLVMEVPIWLDTLVTQLMEKDPDQRPLNADKVAEALRLIKQKVEDQKSAGIEAATKRRIDRTRGDPRLDAEDKEAARAMLGKKKKKKVQPFYTRGWFTILALGLVALVSAGIVYVVFIMPPGADRLYAEAEALMKSGTLENQKLAREEPIKSFLYYHPQHEKAKQMQAWADEIDFEICDRQMHNRRSKKFKVEGPDAREEQLARDALDNEDLGKLTDAAKLWDELSKKKESADPQIHAWGLVGARYRQELNEVDALYRQLERKADENQKIQVSDENARAGLEAVRDEKAKELAKARSKWDDLKGKTEVPRRWYLLAALRSRELRDAIEAKK
jgi:serine/threonine-protein kinase